MGKRLNGWLPEPLWRMVKASVPIACVDIIVSNPTGAVLLGWRVIRPYINVWATPGGRIRMGENVAIAARRILSSHGITANRFYLVGVFPIRFHSRFDISICIAATAFSGNPAPDGTEFKKVHWFKKLPNKTGANYVKMIKKWRKVRKFPQIVKVNEL